jgi:hypothetical protein
MLKDLKNNDKMQKFLVAIAEGKQKHEAIEIAGLDQSNATRDVYPILRTAEAANFIADYVRQSIKVEGAPEAWRISLEMLQDKRISPRIRWDIAKTLLAYAVGMVAPKAEGMAEPPKDVSQMTGAEIMQFRRKLEDEMTGRANASKMIEHELTQYHYTTQDLESLD